ncbi:putative GTP-binding protein-like [Capsicum annuum]|nr:putative GTP-binding protein-like [Capsicum annuum]
MTKQPIAPLPPTPPKIYRVEPINFKEVVQMLTAAPEFQSVSDDSISSSVSGSSSGVQMLTAAPELQSVSNNSVSSSDSAFGSGSGSFNSRRLQNVAPPPLDLSPVSLQRNNRNNNNNNISAVYNDSINEEQERSHVAPRIPSENYFGSCSPLANFPLSPASFAWCSSILFSPGTLTSPSTVL